MKKTLLSFLFILVAMTSFSKQKFGVDLGIGLKGGLNFNKMTGKGWTNSYHTDPHGGFFAHLNKRKIGVQIEAIWSQTHLVSDSNFYGLYNQYYNNALDSLDQGSFRFNMINIPLLLNLKLTQKIWIQLGPQFMGSVSMTDKNRVIKSGVDIIKNQNFNFIGGIWLQFGGEAPLIRVNTGIRYIAGLNNMNDLIPNSLWKTQMIQLHIGFSY